MATSLERKLGPYAVFTISVGAMIGGGLFVLPGLAFERAGPAVILAFAVAGAIAFLAALSKAEMATAMPETGGAYLYVDRAMGPLMGTVAGIGVWFSLVFKAAFALVGLGAYLTLIADVPGTTFALVIAAVLITINLFGGRITGPVQNTLVTALIAALVLFAIRGSVEVETANLEPFLTDGVSGLLSAAAIVFVAYAGVTKVASVAEEVEHPGRNIPLGMLLSVGAMLLLYPAVVYVIVGTTPPAVLGTTTTPVADAAESFFGSFGVDVVTVVAIIALIGAANAGIRAASRYPLAMSRNSLAPQVLQQLGPRGTPTVALIATGVVLIVLVAFVPILDLARLASAFTLAVFAFIHLALISFRQSKLGWYQPEFRSPWYPWVQIFGLAGSIVLLTQLGWVPLAGAIGITAFSVLWYRAFGKSRAIKDSALLDALRIRSTGRVVEMTEEAIASGGHAHVLIPVLRSTRRSRMEDLIRFGTMFGQPGGVVEIVEFEHDDPERTRHPSGIDRRFEERTRELAERMGAEVFVRRLVTDDPEQTLIEYVEDFAVDLVVSDLPREARGTRRFINDMKHVRDHLPCDSIFLRNRTVRRVQNVVIMGTGGPFDVLKISLAARISAAEGSHLRFVHVLPDEARIQQVDSIEKYHHRLEQLVDADTESAVSRATDLIEEISRVASDADLIVMGAPAHRIRIFGDLADRIADSLDVPVMMVHTNRQPQLAWYERALERVIY